jgi:hypothetical protein
MVDAVSERLVATANLVEMPIGERYVDSLACFADTSPQIKAARFKQHRNVFHGNLSA